MMQWLIVDGYNIINEWPELAVIKDTSMELARNKLIDIMQEFSPLLWHKITIVFDAYQTEAEKATMENLGGVEVVYTKEKVTADAYIERLVYNNASPQLLIEVASSDYLEQRLILWRGGKRLPSRELKEKLEICKKELRQQLTKKLPPPKSTLGGQLPAKTRFALEKWRRE